MLINLLSLTVIRYVNISWRRGIVDLILIELIGIEIAKDGRTPPHHFAYALSNDFYTNLYMDIKEGIVNEIYYEYLID